MPPEIAPENSSPEIEATDAATVARPGRPRWQRALLWALLLLPIIYSWSLVEKYRFVVPHADDWSFVSYYADVVNGEGSMEKTLDYVNEHRVVFHRLFFTAVYHLSGGDVRVFSVITFSFITFIFGGMLCLARPLIKRRPVMGWAAALLAVLSIYTPAQVYSLLMAFIYANYVPWVALVGGMLLWRSHLSVWIVFPAAALLTMFGNLCFMMGMLVWPALIPFILLNRRLAGSRARTRGILIALWCAIGVAINCFALAGVGESMSVEHDTARGLDLVLQKPWMAVSFGLNLLANHLSNGSDFERPVLGFAIGAAICVVLAAGLLVLLRKWRDRELFEELLPFITLAGVAAASAAMITVGRITPSMILAHSFHYVVTCVYFLIGTVWVAAIIGSRLPSWRNTPKWWRCFFGTRTLAALAGALVVIHAINWKYGANQMRREFAIHQQEQTAMMFWEHLGNAHLYPLHKMPKISLAIMAIKQHGFLERIPCLPDLKLSNFRKLSDLSEFWGEVSRIEPTADGGYRASGFTHLKGMPRPADGVFFTWELAGDGDGDGEATIFDIAFPTVPEAYFRRAKRLKRSRAQSGDWSVKLRIDALPGDEVIVRAHSFDFEGKRLRTITGAYRFEGRKLVGPLDPEREPWLREWSRYQL